MSLNIFAVQNLSDNRPASKSSLPVLPNNVRGRLNPGVLNQSIEQIPKAAFNVQFSDAGQRKTIHLSDAAGSCNALNCDEVDHFPSSPKKQKLARISRVCKVVHHRAMMPNSGAGGIRTPVTDSEDAVNQGISDTDTKHAVQNPVPGRSEAVESDLQQLVEAWSRLSADARAEFLAKLKST